VRYPWHPWYRRRVNVWGIRNRHGLKVLFCTLDEEHEFPVLEVPEWIFDPVVCGRLERAERARVDGRAPQELKCLLESAGGPPWRSEALKHPHVTIRDAAQYGEVAAIR
jgi:hypothetical protein